MTILSFRAAALVMPLSLFSTGCISVTYLNGGGLHEKLATRPTDFLQQVATLFIDGQPEHKSRPYITEASRLRVEALINGIRSSFQAEHARSAMRLREMVDRDIPSTIQIQPISVTPEPGAMAATDGKQIVISTQVLEALFSNALTGASNVLPVTCSESKLFSEYETTLAALRDVQNLPKADRGEFLAKTRAQASCLDDLELPGFTARLAVDFYGTLGFVLAHEIGHQVLHHPAEETNCHRFRDQETAADKYAATLLSMTFLAASVTVNRLDGLERSFVPRGTKLCEVEYTQRYGEVALCVERTQIKRYAGYVAFLGKGLERAGFKDSDGKGCSYPPTTSRIQFVNEVLEKTLEGVTPTTLQAYGQEKQFPPPLVQYILSNVTIRL